MLFAGKQNGVAVFYFYYNVFIDVCNTEKEFYRCILTAYLLRHHIADATCCFYRNFRGFFPVFSVLDEPGGADTGEFCLLGDKVHQVVDVQNVAAGEDAGNIGFPVLVNDSAVGHRVEGDRGGFAQLVLRDEADREEHGVTFYVLGSFRDGVAAFVHRADGDTGDPVLSVNFGDGVGEL